MLPHPLETEACESHLQFQRVKPQAVRCMCCLIRRGQGTLSAICLGIGLMLDPDLQPSTALSQGVHLLCFVLRLDPLHVKAGQRIWDWAQRRIQARERKGWDLEYVCKELQNEQTHNDSLLCTALVAEGSPLHCSAFNGRLVNVQFALVH